MKTILNKQGPEHYLRGLLTLLLFCTASLLFAQSGQDQNAVKTTTVLIEGVATTAEADALSFMDRAIEIQYVDGLGRPVQKVNQQGSPAGYDAIQVIEYDKQGRPFKAYLPYVSNTTDGTYQNNWSSAQAAFYQASGDQVANSLYPWAESRFETAPLNRLTEQGAAGQNWQLDAHSTKTLLEANTADEVIDWELSNNGDLNNEGYYPAGALKVVITEDESGYETREYFNKQDSTIYTKKEGTNGQWLETYYVRDHLGNIHYVLPPMAVAALQGETTGDCGPEETISTTKMLTAYEGISYRINDGASLKLSYNAQESFRFSFNDGCFYMRQTQSGAKRNQEDESCYAEQLITSNTTINSFGNVSYLVEQGAELTFSAPVGSEWSINGVNNPCFYARMKGFSPTKNAPAMDQYAYQYQYDGRQRIVAKKIPGSGWQYYVYDTWDRLVLTQDANQRTKSPQEWTFTKYDALNRAVISGLYQDVQNRSREAMQQAANSASNLRYELRNSSTHDYTLDRSFPQDIQAGDVLAVSLYDNYNFGFAGDAAYAFQAALGHTVQDNEVKGALTGVKTKVLDGSGTWLKSLSYYDDRNRTIQQVGDNQTGGVDRMSTRYSFDDKRLETYLVRENPLLPVGQQELRIGNSYDYDHTDRLTAIHQQVNGGQEVLLAQYRYNELGELIEKNLHSEDGGSNFLQSVDYRYNIRSWLTHINNADLSNDGIYNDDNSDLFGMEFHYTQASTELQGQPQYTGNISEIHWQDGYHQRKRGYGFRYDAYERLTQAHYADYQSGTTAWSEHVGDFDLSDIQYDKNGNILELQRRGYRTDATFDLIDQLSYSYDGNQLLAVNDQATVQGYHDFKDVSGSTDYSYDANGNLLSDANKDITQIDYNHLNLPERIVFSNGNELNYLYDATGTRLKKTIKESGQPERSIWYIGGIVYNDNALEFLPTDEGRVVPNGGSSFRYEYHYKDHLNNTRLAFSDLDNNGTVDQSEILQVEHYYPFGMSFSGLSTPQVGPQHKFKYNGKELEDEFELNLYDFSARLYDPALGRWHVLDPKADIPNLITHSPYHYSYNNPILYVDPDGENPLRAVLAAAKLIKRAYKIYKKTGKLDVKTLKKAGLDELVDIAGDLVTIFSGNATPVDRLGAAVDLVLGTEFNNQGSKTLKKALKKRKKALERRKNAKPRASSKKTTNKKTGGRDGKQDRLKELADNDKLGKADRGWLKSEINQVKSGNRKTVRNPPGKDLAHERGREAAKGYSYKYSNLQDRKLHKMQHKYDKNGTLNKERPIKQNP